MPVDLVARLLELERQSAGMARRAGVPKEIADLLGREWRSEEELLALNAHNVPSGKSHSTERIQLQLL